MRFLHRLPTSVRLEPPFDHECGLLFLRRNRPDNLFAQPNRKRVRLDVGHKSMLVFSADQGLDRATHNSFSLNRLHGGLGTPKVGDSANRIKLVGFPVGCKNAGALTAPAGRNTTLCRCPTTGPWLPGYLVSQ